MDYKKEIEKLLFDLKNSNIDRAQIEKELNYSENYIDQVLAKGGNKKFYNNLKSLAGRKLQKTSKGENKKAINVAHGTDLNDPQAAYGRNINTEAVLLQILEKAQETIHSQQQTIHLLTQTTLKPPETKNDYPPLETVRPVK